jgi:hypothetical protein
MTAKEKLRRLVDALSEQEAEAALIEIERRRERDPLVELLDGAPLDDEPGSDEEELGAQEAKAEIARGDVVPAERVRREIG